MQPQKSPSSEKHLLTRALSEKNQLISRLLSANPFYFTLAASTKEIETDAVFVGFDYLG
jgi:hypothetical protein